MAHVGVAPKRVFTWVSIMRVYSATHGRCPARATTAEDALR